ncbi:hypothetical protein [Pseudomonas sp. lyk4-40-TSB-59a]|uniref:hypothetical protein n=1 Tax=Pseudomonas sp. lyk4-40-TSB-59a TaxID=3040314 RepID=UPI00255415F2|nr:hypothetical protein [Pseudomonas sp. lyk4-40-TSB-59a]
MSRPPFTRTLFALVLFWGVVLSLAVIILGLIAVDGIGNIKEWNTWMRSNQAALLAWRMPLYALTVYGWYRMRLSLAKRGFSPYQNQRLLYAEVAAIAVLALLELLTLRTN